MQTTWDGMGRIRLFPLLFQNSCSQSSRFLPQARRIVGSGDENACIWSLLYGGCVQFVTPGIQKWTGWLSQELWGHLLSSIGEISRRHVVSKEKKSPVEKGVRSIIQVGPALRFNPLPFYIPFWQKRYPFYIPFVEIWYPFKYLEV